MSILVQRINEQKPTPHAAQDTPDHPEGCIQFALSKLADGVKSVLRTNPPPAQFVIGDDDERKEEYQRVSVLWNIAENRHTL